jgi:hypothetical protein
MNGNYHGVDVECTPDVLTIALAAGEMLRSIQLPPP